MDRRVGWRDTTPRVEDGYRYRLDHDARINWTTALGLGAVIVLALIIGVAFA